MMNVPEWAEVVALMPPLSPEEPHLKDCNGAFATMLSVSGKSRWRDLTDAERAEVYRRLKGD
jgi:hypothetical protein